MAEAQPQHRGIIATIDDQGLVNIQPLGRINNAEFLGIGVHIISVPLRDGISAILRNQLLTGDSLKGMIEIIQQNGEESCGKELSSEPSPLVDSGQSTESSPE